MDVSINLWKFCDILITKTKSENVDFYNNKCDWNEVLRTYNVSK